MKRELFMNKKEKQTYLTPAITVVTLDSTPLLGTVSGTGAASDIGYYGLDNDEEGIYGD